MKLPLHVHYDYYGKTQVIDAAGRIVCSLSRPEDLKFARAMVRKLNRDWRWAIFGWQPFVHTREDWLFDKGDVRAVPPS